MSLKNRRKGEGSTAFPGLRSRRKYSAGSHGRLPRGIAGPVIVVCAIVAVLVTADALLDAGKVHRGVEVGNVSVGGKTPAEARQAVRDQVVGPLEEIEFTDPRRSARTAREMGVSFNVSETVGKAYAVGREGNVLDRLLGRLRAPLGGATIPPEVNFDRAKARAQIGAMAGRVNRQPEEAELKIYGDEVEVTEGREGYRLNPAATMTSVNGAIEDMSGKVDLQGDVLEPRVTTAEAQAAAKKAREALSERITIKSEGGGKSWTIEPESIRPALEVTEQDGKIEVGLNRDRMDGILTNVYNDLTAKTVDASYGFDSKGDVIVKPARFGRSVDGEKLVGDIQGGIFDGKREYRVSTSVQEPEYTTTELQAKKPTELLGKYKTNYRATSDKTRERVENLGIASRAVTGTLLAPGEVFSMNETVSGLEYNQGHVIVNGATSTGLGGGLCQVTSTLYNAVLYAGLDVTERTAHATQLPYIRPGMDATVWFGDRYGNGELDMKFENTTDGYILLKEYVSGDDYIYAEVYGVPTDVEVTMSSEPILTNYDASQWVTYYTRKEGGRVVERDQWKTSYAALEEDGKTIPPSGVPVAEVNGDYFGRPIKASD